MNDMHELVNLNHEKRFEILKREFNDNQCWGLLASYDLSECDDRLIRSADAIEEYVIKLCDLIEMKRFMNTQIVHFGQDEKVAGYSMTQFIETSLISGHFANLTNAAYIDVFSCKLFDPYVAAEFTKQFFRARQIKVNLHFRK